MAAIVVGVGGDGSGMAAVRTAARVANLMGATLVLVFGYDPSKLGPRGGPLEEEILAIGQKAVADARSEVLLSFPKLMVETEFVRDRAVDALITVASARNAEVIAVGHGGEGPMRGALLGSITYEMVHRAPLPVLVVPDEVADLA
jgi:nucleotide-binding universal stress UspA family protein